MLEGDDLTLQQQGSLGETLNKQPGVSSSYFGPGASRPIRPEAGSMAYPRRKPGLWEVRSGAPDNQGLPPARF